jgi:APA family basic amino acid/polyamine antiporter
LSELRRQLGLADGVAVFAGTILGSGIFMAPRGVAGAAPHPVTAVAMWAVGALVAAAGASCYAECGARLPQVGGFFVYLRTVYGKPLAFVAGWVALAVTYPASIAAMARVFAGYLSGLLGIDNPLAVSFLAAGSIALAVLVNSVGVRSGAMSQRILTGAKVSALAILVLAAVLAPRAASVSSPAPALGFSSASAVLGVLVWVLWTYDGWSDVTLLAGELRNPGRDLGRTVAIGIGVLWLLYAGVQLAVLALLPAGAAAGSDHVVADAVAAAFGPAGGRVTAALVVLTTFGSVNAVVFTSSRLGFAMAKDGVFPKAFASVGEGGGPTRSILAIGVMSLVYVFAASFQSLLDFFSFAVWLFYALIAIAVLVLRRRAVGEPATFRAPFGPLAPIVVVAVALFISEENLRQHTLSSLGVVAIIAAGALAYAAWRRLAGGAEPA